MENNFVTNSDGAKENTAPASSVNDSVGAEASPSATPPSEASPHFVPDLSKYVAPIYTNDTFWRKTPPYFAWNAPTQTELETHKAAYIENQRKEFEDALRAQQLADLNTAADNDVADSESANMRTEEPKDDFVLTPSESSAADLTSSSGAVDPTFKDEEEYQQVSESDTQEPSAQEPANPEFDIIENRSIPVTESLPMPPSENCHFPECNEQIENEEAQEAPLTEEFETLEDNSDTLDGLPPLPKDDEFETVSENDASEHGNMLPSGENSENMTDSPQPHMVYETPETELAASGELPDESLSILPLERSESGVGQGASEPKDIEMGHVSASREPREHSPSKRPNPDVEVEEMLQVRPAPVLVTLPPPLPPRPANLGPCVRPSFRDVLKKAEAKAKAEAEVLASASAPKEPGCLTGIAASLSMHFTKEKRLKR